jgi:hypothetical protein
MVNAIFAVAMISVQKLEGPTKLAHLSLNSTAGAAVHTAPRNGTQRQEQAKEISMGDILTNDNRLVYHGYVVEKRYKTVRYDYPQKMQSRPSWLDVSYAVIKRNDKLLATFDDEIYFGIGGNNTRFGLFSFLGEQMKQMLISQEIFRGGSQWIISLTPRYRIIFNGPAWAVGREGDDMGIIDLDNDGVYEITVPITVFYGFANLSPAGTPLPTAIFQYDAKAEKYLPANLQFQDYVVKNIDEQKAVIRPAADPMNHLSDIMSIALDYIFAGKEEEAWTFFEESYRLSDKKEIRAKIRDELRDHTIYRFISQ